MTVCMCECSVCMCSNVSLRSMSSALMYVSSWMSPSVYALCALSLFMCVCVFLYVLCLVCRLSHAVDVFSCAVSMCTVKHLETNTHGNNDLRYMRISARHLET